MGSFSIVPIGTYAASTNFHQPRDTTGVAGDGDRSREDSKAPVRVQQLRQTARVTNKGWARSARYGGTGAHAEEAGTTLPAIQPKRQTIATKRVACGEPKLHPFENGEYQPDTIAKQRQ